MDVQRFGFLEDVGSDGVLLCEFVLSCTVLSFGCLRRVTALGPFCVLYASSCVCESARCTGASCIPTLSSPMIF